MAATATSVERFDPDIAYPAAIPFVLVHLACFAAVWTGVHAVDVAVCAALYYGRIWGVTAGYHRYFSHRTYKTSRVFAFLLGWLAQTSAQRGILWWAARHRHHHKYSDMLNDVHSPRHYGFLYAHVGWIFDRRNDESPADLDKVKDLAQVPELVWLEKNRYLPAIVTGLLVWLFRGWPGLVVGFCWSTVLTWHGTFTINSLSHGLGRRRYYTGDDSRNNWFLALFVTIGEGWHNNHHYFQSAARNGFRWWEIDVTFSVLRVLSWLGIVWDLNEVPAEVVRNMRRVSREQLVRAEEDLVGGGAPNRKHAERAFGVLAQAATESMGPLAANARGTLAKLAVSMSPYAERAKETWAHLVDEAQRSVHDARDALDTRAEHAMRVLAEAAHARFDPLAARADSAIQALAGAAHEKFDPVKIRAREVLGQLADSVHPMADRARAVLADLAASLDGGAAPQTA